MMHFRQRITGLLLIVIASISGCSKREPVPRFARYTFVNVMDSLVIFDLYPSANDYLNNSNLLSRHRVAPSDMLQLELEIGRTYGVDWYSEGFGYTNWVGIDENGNPDVPVLSPSTIKVAAEDDRFSIQSFRKGDVSRMLMLKGNAGSSWRIEVGDSSFHKGTYMLQLKKDFSAILTRVDQPDQQSRKLKYNIIVNKPYTFSAGMRDPTGQYVLGLYYGYTGGIWPATSHADSLTVEFGENPFRTYRAIRQ